MKDIDMDSKNFKEFSREQLSKLSMPEQLQYQKKLNEWKAKKKAEADAQGGGKDGADGAEDGEFK